MGGADAVLLNIMQAATLVLTAYINFGAFSMNYLTLAKDHAKYTDPQNADKYDAHIQTIGLLMEVLTLGLFASFGGVAIKKAMLRMKDVKQRLVNRFSSNAGDAPHIETAAAAGGGRSSSDLSVEMTEHASPEFQHQNPMSSRGVLGSSARLPVGWVADTSPEGKQYFYNKETGETSWTFPKAK